jgi:hypothetical protein
VLTYGRASEIRNGSAFNSTQPPSSDEIVGVLTGRDSATAATPSTANAVDHRMTRSALLIAHRQHRAKILWSGRCRPVVKVRVGPDNATAASVPGVAER